MTNLCASVLQLLVPYAPIFALCVTLLGTVAAWRHSVVQDLWAVIQNLRAEGRDLRSEGERLTRQCERWEERFAELQQEHHLLQRQYHRLLSGREGHDLE